MRADLAKLRALLGLLEEARMLVEAREPGAAGHFQRKFKEDAADFIREHGDELLAIAEAVERAPFEYEFEVWQGDAMQAGGTTTTLESAIDEAAHYRMMYGQDGPVEVKVYERRAIPDAAIDRLLAIGEDG